jgi:hypothetical protein
MVFEHCGAKAGHLLPIVVKIAGISAELGAIKKSSPSEFSKAAVALSFAEPGWCPEPYKTFA